MNNFFNTDNTDSYDSNHAVIYKDSLTYAEIEKIAGLTIDHSFLTKKKLTEYSYKVEKIFMKEPKIIFETIAESGNRDYQEG